VQEIGDDVVQEKELEIRFEETRDGRAENILSWRLVLQFLKAAAQRGASFSVTFKLITLRWLLNVMCKTSDLI
tara:strand:- start:19 stop:237 length:219 start_codon:yes stop_codon:yes gene_type:complete